MNVVLLYSSGSEETVQINDLEEMQALVGGYIQLLASHSADYCMVINEEGKLKNLPINEIATAIAREDFMIFPNDIVVGNVFFCKLSKKTGEFVGLNTKSRVIILGRIARIATVINQYFQNRFNEITQELQGG